MPRLLRDERRALIEEMKAEAKARLADLRSQVQIQKKYIAHLQEQLDRLQGDAVDQQQASPSELSGTLGDKIGFLLRKLDRPMRAKEIAEALEKAGVTTSSASGLLQVVLAELARNKKFENVERGVYKLAHHGQGES